MTLVGWSSVPLFLKHFSHTIDAWTSNGWRYGFSALLWAPVLVVGLARKTLPSGLWKAAILPAVLNSLGQTCFAWAHYKIDPGLLTFGLRLQIVFVSVGAFLLFPGERRVIRNPWFVVGACMVLSGTLAIVSLAKVETAEGPSDASVPVLAQSGEAAMPASGTGEHALGVGLAIASGLLFAAYALSVRRNMHAIPSVTAFAVISQYTAAAMVVLMLVLSADHGAGAWELSNGQLALLLLSAIIGIALGHVFYYASIARLGVAVSSGVVQLQPIIVTGASSVIFGERLSTAQLVFGVLAICGAGVMLSVQHRLARRDARARELEAQTAEQA